MSSRDESSNLDIIKRLQIAKRKDPHFKEMAHKFLDLISNEMKKRSIILKSNWSVDHLCYRVSSDSEYAIVKEQFSAIGDLLIESEVNGRLISTYKLFEPIKYMSWQISLVELPAPKKNKVTATGFEHIEIVCDVSFSELESEFNHCEIDLSGLKKLINKEFEIKFEGCAVKFHHLSLESVIRLEKNKKVYHALIESKVLQILEGYNPLIAGTIPLGAFTEKSQLDILLECHDLNQLQETVQNNFGQFEKFKCLQTEFEGVKTLIINFNYADLPFALFAQPVPGVKQKAYQSFQDEERRLSLTNQASRSEG